VGYVRVDIHWAGGSFSFLPNVKMRRRAADTTVPTHPKECLPSTLGPTAEPSIITSKHLPTLAPMALSETTVQEKQASDPLPTFGPKTLEESQAEARAVRDDQMESPRIAGFYPKGRSDLDEAHDYSNILPSGPSAPAVDGVGHLEPVVMGPFYRAYHEEPVIQEVKPPPEEDLMPGMLPADYNLPSGAVSFPLRPQ
jgi:hypothetical protein